MSSAIAARWTPRQADFDRFAGLSGDDNPIHVDAAFAARTRFGRTVAHGMLLYSRVWALIATARPGARHASQSLMFPAPAYADEELAIALKETVDHCVPSPVAPEARLRHDVGDGQGGGESQTSNAGVPPTPNPSPQGGGESRRRKGKATVYAIRVTRVRDGVEVLTGECTLEEQG